MVCPGVEFKVTINPSCWESHTGRSLSQLVTFHLQSRSRKWWMLCSSHLDCTQENDTAHSGEIISISLNKVIPTGIPKDPSPTWVQNASSKQLSLTITTLPLVNLTPKHITLNLSLVFKDLYLPHNAIQFQKSP